MKTRRWSPDDKLNIILEGIKGVKSVAQICRDNQISQTQYYKWRDKFYESVKAGLNGGIATSEREYKAQIEKLEQIIGKQAIKIEVLKKTQELFGTK